MPLIKSSIVRTLRDESYILLSLKSPMCFNQKEILQSDFVYVRNINENFKTLTSNLSFAFTNLLRFHSSVFAITFIKNIRIIIEFLHIVFFVVFLWNWRSGFTTRSRQHDIFYRTVCSRHISWNENFHFSKFFSLCISLIENIMIVVRQSEKIFQNNSYWWALKIILRTYRR